MAKVGRIRGVVVRVGRIMARGVPFGGEDKAEVEERGLTRELVALVSSGHEADTP